MTPLCSVLVLCCFVSGKPAGPYIQNTNSRETGEECCPLGYCIFQTIALRALCSRSSRIFLKVKMKTMEGFHLDQLLCHQMSRQQDSSQVEIECHKKKRSPDRTGELQEYEAGKN